MCIDPVPWLKLSRCSICRVQSANMLLAITRLPLPNLLNLYHILHDIYIYVILSIIIYMYYNESIYNHNHNHNDNHSPNTFGPDPPGSAQTGPEESSATNGTGTVGADAQAANVGSPVGNHLLVEYEFRRSHKELAGWNWRSFVCFLGGVGW